MNKSKYINPPSCRTCGKCCKSFSLAYDKKLEKDNPIMFSEIKRFQMLDTDKIEIIEKEKVILVKFNFSCKHLRYKDSIYTCMIYDNSERPKLCEEYPYEDTTDCPHMICSLNDKIKC